MTWQEKSELEKLRVEIKKYREFEGISTNDNENSFEQSDDEVKQIKKNKKINKIFHNYLNFP